MVIVMCRLRVHGLPLPVTGSVVLLLPSSVHRS
jgi:hypothetical protein